MLTNIYSDVVSHNKNQVPISSLRNYIIQMVFSDVFPLPFVFLLCNHPRVIL